MLAWLASYPRSGNTFLRIVMGHLYGVASHNDSEASELLGQGAVTSITPREITRQYVDDPPIATLGEVVDSSQLFLAKTHCLPQSDSLPAIYLIRDGRDALLSYAHFVLRYERQQQAFDSQLFRQTLYNLIHEERSPFGTWARNVESWSRRPHTVVIRFEDLIAQPIRCATRIIEKLGWNPPTRSVEPPTFDDLHSRFPDFFRRGQPGAWRTDFPADLLEAFTLRCRDTLARLGYAESMPDLQVS